MADELSRRSFLKAGSAGLAFAGGLGSATVLAASDDIHWHYKTDVLICGTGGAGASAAIFAHDSGAKVMMIEKASVFGGTTSKSGCYVWIPNNFEMQKLGLEDKKDDFLKYTAQYSYPNTFNPEHRTLGLHPNTYDLLSTYYDNANRMVVSLMAKNAVDYEIARLGDRQAPLANDYFEHSRYNKASRGRSLAPVGLGQQSSGGPAVMLQMRNRIEDRGIQIRFRHRASELIVNQRRQVVGVKAESPDGSVVNIRTRKGVVFGTGGYSHNKEYLQKFQNDPVFGSCAIPTCTGDFISIASGAGAQLGNMTGAWRGQVVLEEAVRYVSVPHDVYWPAGNSMFLVNKYGKRCTNERRNYHDRAKSLYTFDANKAEYPSLLTFYICDQRTAELYGGHLPLPAKGQNFSYMIEGNSLTALADNIDARLKKLEASTGGIRLDESFKSNLRETLKRYNRMAENGVDEDFGRGDYEYDVDWFNYLRPPKSEKWEETRTENPTLYPMSEAGPYYAVILAPGTLGTNGGPVINRHGQVWNYDDKVIDGLYGAGNCIASPAADSYWAGGATIGSAMTFGMLAGEHVAASELKELS
jgi:succinate dehydrogenase/fumarate reductase flavoprotein subunit